jgi:hypothetical protein
MLILVERRVCSPVEFFNIICQPEIFAEHQLTDFDVQEIKEKREIVSYCLLSSLCNPILSCCLDIYGRIEFRFSVRSMQRKNLKNLNPQNEIVYSARGTLHSMLLVVQHRIYLNLQMKEESSLVVLKTKVTRNPKLWMKLLVRNQVWWKSQDRNLALHFVNLLDHR